MVKLCYVDSYVYTKCYLILKSKNVIKFYVQIRSIFSCRVTILNVFSLFELAIWNTRYSLFVIIYCSYSSKFLCIVIHFFTLQLINFNNFCEPPKTLKPALTSILVYCVIVFEIALASILVFNHTQANKQG